MDVIEFFRDLPTDWMVIAIAAGVVVLALIALAVALIVRRRRRRRLADRFGAEYDRTVAESRSEREAVRELSDRERRREQLSLRPVSGEQRERFRHRWEGVQRDFVDAPTAALQRADALFQEATRARGYPAGDFDQRLSDLSVDYGHLVGSYRRLRALLDDDRQPDTEAQRRALIDFRTLFDAILEPGDRDDEERVLALSGAGGNGHGPAVD